MLKTEGLGGGRFVGGIAGVGRLDCAAMALSVATAPGRGETCTSRSASCLGPFATSVRRPLLCFFIFVPSRAGPAGYPSSANVDAWDYRRASKTGQVGQDSQASSLRSMPLLTSLSR